MWNSEVMTYHLQNGQFERNGTAQLDGETVAVYVATSVGDKVVLGFENGGSVIRGEDVTKYHATLYYSAEGYVVGYRYTHQMEGSDKTYYAQEFITATGGITVERPDWVDQVLAVE